MWVLIQFEHKNEIGVYGVLTNSYCLLPTEATDFYYSCYERELDNVIPIVHTTIGNCRSIGCVAVGNRYGLLVPESITEVEMQHLRNNLPESVKIRCIDDRLSALGNVIACNDHVALVHPDIDKVTEEIIADVLNVEVFRRTIADNPLVGTCMALTNEGGMVHRKSSENELIELSSLLQVSLSRGTVNMQKELISSGLLVNDWVAFIGQSSSYNEVEQIERAFRLDLGHSRVIRNEWKAVHREERLTRASKNKNHPIK